MFGGLAFRVLLFLSLALLPIGLIAVVQTREIAEQSRNTAELSLIAVTEQAAATERTVLQEAFGAGRALSSVVELLRGNPEQCSRFLKNYKRQENQYLLVGFIANNGLMNCSSTSEQYDLSDTQIFKDVISQSERWVTPVEKGSITGQAVSVVTVPVFRSTMRVGHTFISIGRDTLEVAEAESLAASPLSLITFNRGGQIISSQAGKAFTDAEMPASYALNQLTGPVRQVFTAQNAQGVDRIYAVIPLVPGNVFAMSVWPIDTPLLQTDFSGRASALLPIFMWVASLVVAFWALHRLAITHIRKLGRQMRQFAINRTLPRKPLGDQVPVEIVAMEQSFMSMANSILQDEARLEDSLREKNILLKEVHHRVKNNLQLISSIMNMQIRQAPTEANRQVLLRLQDRILSLATVHKSLYQDNEMTRVDGGVLLREIVSRSLAVGMAANSNTDVTEDYDQIMIGPDDAAPLTLLVSEAVTNALKNIPQDQTCRTRIDISLKYIEAEVAMLRVVNTSGGVAPEGGTGLGSKLIQAFARQLNGNLEIGEADNLFKLELTFPVPLADKEVHDY